MTRKTLGGEDGPDLSLEEIIFTLRPDRPRGCGQQGEKNDEALIPYGVSMSEHSAGLLCVKTVGTLPELYPKTLAQVLKMINRFFFASLQPFAPLR
jgi:hypothetical protein